MHTFLLLRIGCTNSKVRVLVHSLYYTMVTRLREANLRNLENKQQKVEETTMNTNIKMAKVITVTTAYNAQGKMMKIVTTVAANADLNLVLLRMGLAPELVTCEVSCTMPLPFALNYSHRLMKQYNLI